VCSLGRLRRLDRAHHHGDLFQQADFGQRWSCPHARQLYEQGVKRQRGKHRNQDGQGNPARYGVTWTAAHERLTLAVNW
jgi:hypothetical protein